MISYDVFVENFRHDTYSRVNFFYEGKEYVIARETDPETGKQVFIYADEKGSTEYDKFNSLLENARFSSRRLGDVWENVELIPNDSLEDNDYIEMRYGEELGRILHRCTGTAESRDRYLTQYFLPASILSLLAIVTLVICTVLITKLTWTIFAIIASVILLAFIVSQVSYFGNSKKFQRGNPRGVLYLLEDGAVILTAGMESAVPYDKIIRLCTEPGISITCYKTIYSFTANQGKDAAEILTNKHTEIKERRKAILRKAFTRKD